MTTVLPARAHTGHPSTCHCPPCKTDVERYRRDVYRLQAYGRWHPWADAGPVRDHVQSILADGMGIARLAAVSGVPQRTIRHLLYGCPGKGAPPAARVRRRNAERLLAVPASAPEGRVLVDATGTRRRIQALSAIGQPIKATARRAGLEFETVRRIASGQQQVVTAKTAAKIRALYGAMWDEPAHPRTKSERIGASRARNMATRNNWPPPMAWDDIDDPDAEPQGWRPQTRNGA